MYYLNIKGLNEYRADASLMKQALYSVFIKDIFNYKESMTRKAYWSTIGFIYLFLLLVQIPLGTILILPLMATLLTDPSIALAIIVSIQAFVWLWIGLAMFSATVRRFRSVGVPAWILIYLPVTLALILFIGLGWFILGLFASIVISIMPDRNNIAVKPPEALIPNFNKHNVAEEDEIETFEVYEDKGEIDTKKKSNLGLWLVLGTVGLMAIPTLLLPPLLNLVQQQTSSSNAGLAALQSCVNFEKAYIAARISGDDDAYGIAIENLDTNLEILKSANNSEYQTLLGTFDARPYATELVVLECTKLGYPILDDF